MVVWLCRLGLLSHRTPHTLTLCGGGGRGCETGVSIHIIPISVIFQEGLLRRLSGLQHCFFVYTLSTVATLGTLALCCLISCSSNIPEAGAMFVKIEHKTAGSSQRWSHAGASFFSWDQVSPSLLPPFTALILSTTYILSCSRHSAAFLDCGDHTWQ